SSCFHSICRVAHVSYFASVEMAPGDPILGLTETYLADARPNKINLGVGIYVDEQGHIPLLRSVHEVEQAMAASARPRGYLPIDGLPAYVHLTQQLLFGVDSPLLEARRAATAQTIGGSAALRVAADLLRQVAGSGARIAISNPSWGNHHVVFRTAGFALLEYRYYDPASHGLDFAGMLEDLGRLEPGTVVLLHACCHNPTGVDLTTAQWQQTIDLLKERRLLPFIDMAYQGFDQGIVADATAVRLLAVSGIEAVVVANSYSKSFSLYVERGGAAAVQDQADHSCQLLESGRARRQPGRRRAWQQRAARPLGAGAGRDARAHPRHAGRPGRAPQGAWRAGLRLHPEPGRHVLLFGPEQGAGAAPARRARHLRARQRPYLRGRAEPRQPRYGGCGSRCCQPLSTRHINHLEPPPFVLSVAQRSRRTHCIDSPSASAFQACAQSLPRT